MTSGAMQPYCAGLLTGAGMALFALFVLSQAVPISLEHWPRIAIGAVGLGLLAAGLLLSRRLRKPTDPTGD